MEGKMMVVDVGVVKNHIKPKADSTLYNMRKTDLIEYIRTLEHNYNVAVSFNENQAKYIESLGFKGVVHGQWEYWAGGLTRCPVCGYEYTDYLECKNYCGNCGAKMDGGKADG